jgi:hypothetical protein
MKYKQLNFKINFFKDATIEENGITKHIIKNAKVQNKNINKIPYILFKNDLGINDEIKKKKILNFLTIYKQLKKK